MRFTEKKNPQIHKFKNPHLTNSRILISQIQESSDSQIQESSDSQIQESSDSQIQESSDSHIQESSDSRVAALTGSCRDVSNRFNSIVCQLPAQPHWVGVYW